MPFFDADNTLSAYFFFAAERFNVYAQEPGSFNQVGPFGNFTPPAGRLKNHHCHIVVHSLLSSPKI
jgi:hypothetical protein